MAKRNAVARRLTSLQLRERARDYAAAFTHRRVRAEDAEAEDDLGDATEELYKAAIAYAIAQGAI